MKPSTEPIIRYATEEDVPTIIEFIKQDAVHHDAIDRTDLSASRLLDHMSFASYNLQHSAFDTLNQSPITFTPGFVRSLLVIAPEGEVAGVVLYYFNFSSWRTRLGITVEDLFVAPNYRRRGYGRLLFREMAKEVQRNEGDRLEWVCSPDNSSALKFYESLGARRLDEWAGLRVEGDALLDLAGGEQ